MRRPQKGNESFDPYPYSTGPHRSGKGGLAYQACAGLSVHKLYVVVTERDRMSIRIPHKVYEDEGEAIPLSDTGVEGHSSELASLQRGDPSV